MLDALTATERVFGMLLELRQFLKGQSIANLESGSFDVNEILCLAIAENAGDCSSERPS
jgi:hypothetical protein